MIRDVHINLVHPSPTNPRKTFDEAKLAELAESIRGTGVLQPILVRPDEHEDGVTRYEIVAGERRWRASRLAGLVEIPAVVREMSDEEVVEAQVIENGQREDVHPLEEADGYRLLIEAHGRSVDDVAAKVGKSRAYVYGRLKLCALGPDGRKAYIDGKLTASTALYVARVPAELQPKAVEKLTAQIGWRGVMSARDASQLIQEEFMLRLKGAPFPIDSLDLVEGVPPCTTCPKRTGNQAELFDDVGSADVCTDPPCFKRKTDAAWTRKTEKYRARGVDVLRKSVVRQNWDGTLALTSDEYVAATDKIPGDAEGRTYKQVLGSKGVTAIARTPKHTAMELIAVDGLKKKLEEAGVGGAKVPTGKKGQKKNSEPSWQKENRDWQRKQEIEKRVRARLASAVVETAPSDEVAWRWLARESVRRGEALPIHRLGLEDGSALRTTAVQNRMLAAAAQLDLDGAKLFVLEASVLDAWNKDDLDDAIAHFGLSTSRAALEKQVVAELDAEAKAKTKVETEVKAAKKKKGAKKKSKTVAARMARSKVGTCRVCGCTDAEACPEGCVWIEPDLCSECEGE